MENGNKIKLLKLFEFLRQESDEAHPITASDICKRLNEFDISCDRKTLTKDIKTLNDFGYEVMSVMIGHEKAYYVEDRSFSVPEIRILIDAVQAATFITDHKTAELVNKIGNLGGSHCAEILKSNTVYFNIRKHSNEAVYYNIDLLEKAIQEHKKVTFLYFDIDENGEIEYRKNGDLYVSEPLALMFNDDNYYLISCDPVHCKLKTYRIDKIKQINILDENIGKIAFSMRLDAKAYATESFRMYEGKSKNVTIAFDKPRMSAIYDKFGEDIKIKRVNENEYTATVRLQESPTFWGWLFQFEGNIRIISPNDMIEECKKQIRNLYEKMNLKTESENVG